ncbi:hypothetical protein ALC57_05173 [Trachymyrmex cornetzi]|uniref:RNase H type-1 domain-containing protein n=1 Tax=Trachymyrmex cornetzi TaxID=471704 RepID=A0A151JBQ5_9HYME|nr:hypothetical protein ALC57_05173 [Trachymyrmex cornetzi]
MCLSTSLRDDFFWWQKILADPEQANIIRSGHFALEIFSDASLNGWGVACGTQRSHGWWAIEERDLYINALELKAAFFGLKCFATNWRDVNILLRIDNTTAISYINRYGSVKFPHLSALAKDIWQWCETRNLFLFASYIPPADNFIADEESRRTDTDTEWSLSVLAFDVICQRFGHPEVDLFASTLNAKCECYLSWFPDPGTWAVDAFTIAWGDLPFYAFPPFILISRVLRKIVDDSAEGILVVPWWPSQPWFPLFQRLLISEPIIFDPAYDLLSAPLRDHHPAYRTLSLAAGHVSGRPSKLEGFQSPP